MCSIDKVDQKLCPISDLLGPCHLFVQVETNVAPSQMVHKDCF